jgi:hypothetical protein
VLHIFTIIYYVATDPKAMEQSDHGVNETYKTVSQNKHFLFISWLSQVFVAVTES